jgi:hypothetical protein
VFHKNITFIPVVVAETLHVTSLHIFPIRAIKIYSQGNKPLNYCGIIYMYTIFKGAIMTANELLVGSNILDTHIKDNLLALNKRLRHTVNTQKFHESINTIFAQIQLVIKNTIESKNFADKHWHLAKMSNLCLQIKGLLEKQNQTEFRKQIDFLNRLSAVYTKIYDALHFIFKVEHESYLVEKYHQYTLGYEIFAEIIAEGQFLNCDVCRGIEMTANAALQTELAEINKEENIQDPYFLRTAGRMRIILTSIVWALDEIKEDGKVKGYTNTSAPHLKHMGRPPKEKSKQHKGGMKFLKKQLDRRVSAEEAVKRDIELEILRLRAGSETLPDDELYPEEW